MPLIEIINITILAFSIGLLALIGISYLVYRYRETTKKTVDQINKSKEQLFPQGIARVESSTNSSTKTTKSIPRYQIIKTYTHSSIPENNKETTAEKYFVVNRNLPSIKRTHSPKIIYLVTSPSRR